MKKISLRNKAKYLFQEAKNVGKIVPKNCEVCRRSKNIHGHHPDYNKPLMIVWLCRKHHREWHKNNKAKGKESPHDIVMIGMKKTTKDKLKMKALIRGMSMKDLLKEFANQK